MRVRSVDSVRRVLSFLILTFLALWPLGAAQGPDTTGLADQLRDAEKIIKSEDARTSVRSARRALDRAAELSEKGDRTGADSELQNARVTLEKTEPLMRDESKDALSAIREVRDALAPPLAVTNQGVQTAAGLHVVTFDTLQGTVTVNLPDDMAAGDTISGTVIAEAKGATPEDVKRNQGSLSGVVVEMEDQKTAASDPGGRGNWSVPDSAVTAIPMILKDRQGRTIGKVDVPVAKVATSKPSAFQLPSGGQTGRPVTISGPFDGDFATSSVKLAGKAVDVLAESPRKLIARSPTGSVGVATLEVAKQGYTTQCEYRNLSVSLSAPKLNLKSGEKTTMTIKVDGADGMKQNVPLSVVNLSPSVVRIDSGDKQTIDVDPRTLSNGSWTASRGLTGVMPGGFNITASIAPGGMPPAECSKVATGNPPPSDQVAHMTPPAVPGIEPMPANPTEEETRGRFRVTLTGFLVNHQTFDMVLERDGRGDEVYAMVNWAELAPTNRILGALRRRQSVNYGDTSGRPGPITLITGLDHLPPFWTIKAGSASRETGGLVTGDHYPAPFDHPGDPMGARPMDRGRFIPMVLWEGELRQGGRSPNAVVLLPTIWENDNITLMLNAWNRQVDTWIRHFAANSARYVRGTTPRTLIDQSETVLTWMPERNDYDRPVGTEGDTWNPLAADPFPATFRPAVMLLTFTSAQTASESTTNSSTMRRGAVDVRYRDGHNYGDGDYTMFLLVERLPDS